MSDYDTMLFYQITLNVKNVQYIEVCIFKFTVRKAIHRQECRLELDMEYFILLLSQTIWAVR